MDVHPASPARRAFRLVEARASEIELDGVVGKVLFPSPRQGPWWPFEGFAEARMAAVAPGEPHLHESEEVVNYVLEGTVRHLDHAGNVRDLPSGSVARLSTKSARRHDLGPVPGSSARWLSLTVRLPEDVEPPARPFEFAGPPRRSGGSAFDPVPVAGASARVASACGLACWDLRFGSEAPVTIPVPSGRRGVVYVADGTVSVNALRAPAGVGVLTESIGELELVPDAGSRAFLSTVPAPRG